jgi:hypothetical protein
MRKVIDLGQQRSSRKRTEKESGRVKLEEENKHKNKLEVEKEETAKPRKYQDLKPKQSPRNLKMTASPRTSTSWNQKLRRAGR